MRVEHSLTIDEIAERLALSRTTVFHWVRDLPIERKGRPPTGGQLKGSLAMQRKYRLLRENAYADGLATFDVLARDPTFRDFVCLYLAEGSKRDRNKVQVCNSDPAVMILCHDWLNRLTDRPQRYSVQYHADQDHDELRRFWASSLGIAPAAVQLLPKSNSGRLATRTWRCVHGVLSISVNDTLLRARVGGWMDRLPAGWD
jgi:hypothetical protein